MGLAASPTGVRGRQGRLVSTGRRSKGDHRGAGNPVTGSSLPSGSTCWCSGHTLSPRTCPLPCAAQATPAPHFSAPLSGHSRPLQVTPARWTFMKVCLLQFPGTGTVQGNDCSVLTRSGEQGNACVCAYVLCLSQELVHKYSKKNNNTLSKQNVKNAFLSFCPRVAP